MKLEIIAEPIQDKKSTGFDRLGAIGEELTKYQLLARGWDVINLNLIGNNKPNADILAVKGKIVVRLQVKTSRYKDWVQLGWITEGKTNVNGKPGDKADYFVMIGHPAPEEYNIYVIPQEYLKNWEQRCLDTHLKNGNLKNSGYIYFGDANRESKFDINRNGDEFRPYRNAWHLLEPN